mmetsp:Transcript_25579/g.55722  ORF Transcript_25579/g.55722 Transcript_25579/m.55722 type:complete len:269 (+) Transcript_25579:223-1029(+)
MRNTLPAAASKAGSEDRVEARNCITTDDHDVGKQSTYQPQPSKSVSDHGLSSITSQLSGTEALLRDMKARAYERSASLRKDRVTPASSPATASRSSSQPAGSRQMSTGRRSQPATKNVDSAFQQRLEQELGNLASLTLGVKEALRGHPDSGPPLAKFQCKNMAVGKATSAGSSFVSVYSDRLEYYFHHKEHGKVHMVMRFRDMEHVSLDISRMTLCFHVNKPLHMFAGEYNHQVPQHLLSFQLLSATDAMQLKDSLGMCSVPLLVVGD